MHTCKIAWVLRVYIIAACAPCSNLALAKIKKIVFKHNKRELKTRARVQIIALVAALR